MTSLCKRALLAGLGALSLSAAAFAQYPNKPIKIIVPFLAGGTTDIMARAVAADLQKAFGQAVVVENRAGAGGNIGADAVAKARDGDTIGLMINGNLTIARLLNPALRYDPATDFAPISLIGVAPLVLVAPVSAPGADARAFLDAARQAGNSWSYGSPGVGTVGHLGMELLKARTGIAPVHVPYPGYAQVFSGLVRGELQLSMLPPALAQTQIAAGKLRGIGVTSSGRSPLMPGLPSLADAGVKNFNLEIWNAVVAPASMPAAHVAKLAEVLGAIVRTPEMRAQLFQQGWQAVGSSPEGLARRIKADTTSLGTIIRAQNIRVQ